MPTEFWGRDDTANRPTVAAINVIMQRDIFVSSSVFCLSFVKLCVLWLKPFLTAKEDTWFHRGS
jgi:hypothetical protein